MNLPKVSVVIPTHNRKAKVVRLIESLMKSNYPNASIEIIVIDAASSDGTYVEVKKNFPLIHIYRSDEELWPAASRNVGIKISSGDLLLFIDDDNLLDVEALHHLVGCMVSKVDVGICAPLMLYSGSDEIWCAGIKRNMVTSITTFLHEGEKLREDLLPPFIESDDFPNCFMVRREIIMKEKIAFDEIAFPINFEESDFICKIKQLGFKAVCVTKAIDWHDARRSSQTGFESELRTYYFARNRILFQRRYTKVWEFALYIVVFNWVIMSYYLWTILSKISNKRITIIKSYLKGLRDGIREVLMNSL